MSILEGNKINCKAIYDEMVDNIRTDLDFYFNTKRQFFCVLENKDFASSKYVELKVKTAKECGIDIEVVNLNRFIEIQNRISYRESCAILQLPASQNVIDKYMDYSYTCYDIDELRLDDTYISLVDFDEPYDAQKRYPATVLGVMAILDRIFNDLSGKKIAVVGCRSRTVGVFIPSILLQRNATVSMYHSKSKIQDNEFETFDVVISCVGKAGLISQKHFGNKHGCVCIDIGVSRGEDNKVVGDFDKDIRDYQYYTPYVNGMGLLTRIFLMHNYMTRMFDDIICFGNKDNDNGDYFLNENTISDAYIINFCDLCEKTGKDRKLIKFKEFVSSWKDVQRRTFFEIMIDEKINSIRASDINSINSNDIDYDDDDDFPF